MRTPFDEDEEGMKDKVLEMLGGEVDDYAGSKLEGEEPNANQGVTIEIAVKPHGAEDEEAKEKFAQEEEEEGHDDVRHALGLCKGGCVS